MRLRRIMICLAAEPRRYTHCERLRGRQMICTLLRTDYQEPLCRN